MPINACCDMCDHGVLAHDNEHEAWCKLHEKYVSWGDYCDDFAQCTCDYCRKESNMEEKVLELVEASNLEEDKSTSKRGTQVQSPVPLTDLSDLLKELKEAGVKKFNIGGIIIGEF